MEIGSPEYWRDFVDSYCTASGRSLSSFQRHKAAMDLWATGTRDRVEAVRFVHGIAKANVAFPSWDAPVSRSKEELEHAIRESLAVTAFQPPHKENQ